MISPFASARDAYGDGVFPATHFLRLPLQCIWAPCAVEAATINIQLALLWRYGHGGSWLSCQGLFFAFHFRFHARFLVGDRRNFINYFPNVKSTGCSSTDVSGTSVAMWEWRFILNVSYRTAFRRGVSWMHMAQRKRLCSEGGRFHCFVVCSGCVRRYDVRQNRKYDDFGLIVITIAGRPNANAPFINQILFNGRKKFILSNFIFFLCVRIVCFPFI